MRIPKLENCCDEVIVEIRRTVNNITSDNEWGLLVMLMKRDGISHRDLLNKLELTEEELEPIFKPLARAGLAVRMSAPRDLYNKNKHCYKATELAFRVVDALYNAFIPESLEYSSTSIESRMTPEEFNEKFPMGSPVRYYPEMEDDGSLSGKPLNTVTRSTAWTISGETVVLIDGIEGAVLVSHLRKRIVA